MVDSTGATTVNEDAPKKVPARSLAMSVNKLSRKVEEFLEVMAEQTRLKNEED